MRLILAVWMFFSGVGSKPPEPVPASIMTLPVDHDPSVCFPQRFVRTVLVGDRVDVEVLKRHPDRRLWVGHDLVVFIAHGKFGYCDRRGVVRIPAIYDDALTFEEGRAVVKVSDKYGYIDTTGTYIVRPTLDWAYGFRDGLGCVQCGELWGIVDRQGTWIKRPIYHWLSPLVGGIRATTLDGKEGWVNSLGNIARRE